MKRRTSAPFLQLSDSTRADDWIYELNHGSPLPLGDTLPDWDYGAALKVSRRLRLDYFAAGKELGLTAVKFELALLIEVGSGQGTLPREIIHHVREPIARDAVEHRVEFELPSRWMSSQLSLRTIIMLARDIASSNPLSPSKQGARLWTDRIVSRLEGHDPRFPMEVISFNRLFHGRPHQHAPWHLRWNAVDLERDFYSAVRLYLNEDQHSFVKRVQAHDQLTLQALMGDVISQMCESALRTSEGTDRLQDADDTTLGGQIRYWLLRVFSSVPEASASLEQRPGEFRAAILASAGFDA